MSSPHPPQVKWFSFLLLVFYVELPSPVTGGLCQLQCAIHRSSRSRYEAYTLNCNDYGYDAAGLRDCTSKCPFCDPSICDPNTPHIFKCPAIDLARCEKHCDNNRPPGSTAAYTLDCQTKSDIDKCKNQCSHCTFEICDSDKPNIFNCPAVLETSGPVSESCTEYCDAEREDEYPYELDCISVDEFIKCMNTCKFCPKTICNPYDPYLFNCPKGPTVCELLCNRNRPQGSSSAYVYYCGDSNEVCKNNCRDCPQICDSKDPKVFKCPAKGISIPSTATTTTTKNPSIGKPEPFTQEPVNEQSSTLAVVGIVFGILILLLVVGGAVYLYIRKMKAQKKVKPKRVSTVFEFAHHHDHDHELSPPVSSEPSSSSIPISEPSSSAIYVFTPTGRGRRSVASSSKGAFNPKSRKIRKSKK